MTAIINGDSPSVTFSDGTTQATSAIVSGKVPYTNLPAGSVLQVVTTTLSSQFTTTSTTYVSTGLGTSITPKFSTSKILILMSSSVFSSASAQGCITVYKNGSNLVNTAGFNNQYVNGAASEGSNCIMYLDSPATTSSTSYTIYMKNSNNTASIFFNAGGDGNNSIASLILMEIAS